MNRTFRTGQLRATAAVFVLAGSASACFLAGHPAAAPAGDVASLEARVNARPADTESALRLAAAYRAAKRMDVARVLLERTTANAPANDAAAMLLGLAYEDLGRLDDARSLYARRAATARTATMRSRFLGRMVVVQRLELIARAKEAVAREAVLAQTPPRPGTVAVFPFAFAGDDAQLRPLSRALAEMLATDLAQTDRLTVLERARVQALLDEASLTRSGLADAASSVRSGHLLGAAEVVQGRIGGAAGRVTLDAQLVRVGSDALVPAVTREAEVRRVLDAEKELALGLYAQMGVQLTAAERERVSRRPTENVQALLAFGMGLEHEDAGDFRAAAADYHRAASLDPAFAAARSRAAAADGAAGAALSTEALAGLLMQEYGTPPELGGLAIEDVANLPLARDPASEGLGGEQVGRSRSGIEIVIRRP